MTSRFDLTDEPRRAWKTARLVLAASWLAMAGLAGPLGASPPLPPPPHSYYGPIRICDGLFAIDVRAGEGYVEHGSHSIYWKGGALGVGERWIYGSEALRHMVRALGEIELSGDVRLERVTFAPGITPDNRILCLYDTGDGGPFPKMAISSPAFDGSERDRALLERIAFGSRAQAMCAAVPDELRPMPQREDREAGWLEPVRHPGPLTICVAGFAFDVGSGEAAILPWRRDAWYFRIAAGERRMAVERLLKSIWRRGDEPDVQGSLLHDPRFLVQDVPELAVGAPLRLFAGPGTRHVLLSNRADVAAYGPYGGSPVSFTFDDGASEAERQAFIARLRTRRPDDHCFEAESR